MAGLESRWKVGSGIRVRATLLFIISTVIPLLVYSQQTQSHIDDVTEGQDKNLECRFNPNLYSKSPSAYWIRTNNKDRDNVAIGATSLDNHYTVDFKPNEGIYDLKINGATYEKDNGKFECKIKEAGTGSELFVRLIKLTVLMPPGPPQITTSHPVATEGRPYNITCSSIGGSPDPEIKWFKSGSTEPLGGEVKVGGSRDAKSTNTLTINVGKDDDGAEYRCTVWNRALAENDRKEQTVTLNVNYFPRISILPFNPLKIQKDVTETITCKTEAKPSVTSIRWMRNGRLLSNNAQLTVRASSVYEGGLYTCVADNGLGATRQEDLNVDVLYAPVVQVESKIEARDGAQVSVKCNVTANPPVMSIEWVKEGDPDFIQPGDTLRLEGVTAEDHGRYWCKASNQMIPSGASQPVTKTGNASLALLIRHAPGRAFILPEKTVAAEGESYTMTCQSSPPGYPEPSYRWWREGNVSLASGKTFTLSTARLTNEGQYFCQPTNELGQGSVATTTLKVLEPPRLVSQLQLQETKRAGDRDYSLSCSARGKPKPSVRWLKDQEIIESDGYYEIVTSDSYDQSSGFHVTSILHFRGQDRENSNQLVADDRGQYDCQFENEARIVTTTQTLKIEHAPLFRLQHDKVASDLDESVFLECRVQAFPKPNFEWTFEKSNIKPNGVKYEINDTNGNGDVYSSFLTVNKVQEKDFGRYTCVVSNSISSAKKAIHLQVKGPPEEPTDMKVLDVSHDRALIGWKDGFNGGYRDALVIIAGRSLADDDQMVPAEFRSWDCQYMNPCNITGLRPQTTYMITAYAKNMKGHSPNATEISFSTPVDMSSIPVPQDVKYSKDNKELTFVVPRSNDFRLVSKVGIVVDGHMKVYGGMERVLGQWNKRSIDAEIGNIDDIKVALCDDNNNSICTSWETANKDVVHRPILSEAGLSTAHIIAIAVASAVACLILLGVVGVVICRCRTPVDEKAKKKKDYEMESSNARPKVITAPYYPQGIANKGVENSSMDSDDQMKNGVYTSGYPYQNNGLMTVNGHHIPNGFSYLDPEPSLSQNGGSIPSQDSLWKGHASDMNSSSERPYPPYDPYMYSGADDYHHMQEDMLNRNNKDHIINGDPYAAVQKHRKRSDHMDPTYHDVSGLPDPYLAQIDEEDKHINSMSFDESLESGYSTPNSRNRRVIREIIV